MRARTIALVAMTVANCTPAPHADVVCEPDHGHGETLWFAIDQLVIDPDNNPDTRHHGFDLDGLASTDLDPGGCLVADYFALEDTDQNCADVDGETCVAAPGGCFRRAFGCDQGAITGCHAAVDNQMPTLANLLLTIGSFDIRVQLAGDVDRARNVTLVQLSDVDDLQNDPSIRVRLYRGHLSVGQRCGTAVRGLTYQIDRSSLREGGGIDDARFEIEGDIIDGRVRTAGDDQQTFPLPLSPITDFTGPSLLARRVRLGFTLSRDFLENGNFGGMVRGEEWFATLTTLSPDFASVWRGLIGGYADLPIDGVCDGTGMNPPLVGALSFGFGVHAMGAVIDPVAPIVEGPQAGGCESVATADGGAMDAAVDGAD